MVAAAIAAMNAAVFACFRIKGLQRVMYRYFTLSAVKSKHISFAQIV
jgi:hypothetical protein